MELHHFSAIDFRYQACGWEWWNMFWKGFSKFLGRRMTGCPMCWHHLPAVPCTATQMDWETYHHSTDSGCKAKLPFTHQWKEFQVENRKWVERSNVFSGTVCKTDILLTSKMTKNVIYVKFIGWKILWDKSLKWFCCKCSWEPSIIFFFWETSKIHL